MGLQDLDARFITLFLDSFQSVFAQLFNCDAAKGPVTVWGHHNSEQSIAVMTGVVGDHHTGMVVFWIKDHTARKLVGHLDPTATEFTETLYEGLGEFVNIVSGNAVRHLSKNRIQLAITPPSLVVGNTLEMHLLNQNAYSITMLSPFGEIGIDIAIKRS